MKLGPGKNVLIIKSSDNRGGLSTSAYMQELRQSVWILECSDNWGFTLCSYCFLVRGMVIPAHVYVIMSPVTSAPWIQITTVTHASSACYWWKRNFHLTCAYVHMYTYIQKPWQIHIHVLLLPITCHSSLAPCVVAGTQTCAWTCMEAAMVNVVNNTVACVRGWPHYSSLSLLCY